MPLPLGIAIAGLAVSTAGTGFSLIGGNKQRKAARAAEKERKRQAAVAAGADAFAQSQAMADPFYDDDPFSSNEKKLYADGGSDWLSPEAFTAYSGMISNIGGMINSGMQTKYAQDDVKRLKTEGAAMNLALSNKIAMDAQKERNAYLSNRYNYATGGKVSASDPLNGVIQQSSNTAMIAGGTHESGRDVPFVRKDGSSAKVEGGEGMRTTPNGVDIFSDRIAVPGEDVSVAKKFADLSSLKGNLEKELKTDANVISRNTKKRQIMSASKAIDHLFAIQEGLKELAGNVKKGDKFAFGGEGDDKVNKFDVKSLGNGKVEPVIKNAITNIERKEGSQFEAYSVVNPADSTIIKVTTDGNIVGTYKYKTDLEREFKTRFSYANSLRSTTPEQRAKANIDEADYQRIISETDYGIAKRGISRDVKKYATGGTDYEKDPYGFFSKKDPLGILSSNLKITKPNDVNHAEFKDAQVIEEKPSVGSKFKSTAKTVFNTMNSQGGMNALATTLTLMDNIYNAKLMDKMKPEDARFVPKVSLDKHYDTSAEEHAVKSQVQGFYENVDKNVTSSAVGLNMKLSAMAEGLGKLNQIQQNKNRIESDIANKEILVNSEIDKANATIYNQHKDEMAAHYMRKSANVSNAIDDISQGLLRGIKIKTDKEKFMVEESRYAQTGVTINQLEEGFYKEAGADKIDKAIDDIIASGRTYEDYAKAIDGHNSKATAGSKRKKMSKEEYSKKQGK